MNEVTEREDREKKKKRKNERWDHERMGPKRKRKQRAESYCKNKSPI